MKTELFSKADLLDTLSMLAMGRGTPAQILARMQKVMLNSPEAMRSASLLAGGFRVGLTEAMLEAQTLPGRKYAACIICGQPVSRDKGQDHPSSPTLLLLLPSILWADEETTGTDKATRHRLGQVPGNIAVACKACNEWNTARPGQAHTADTLGDHAAMVLTSWEGITAMKRSDTESKDAAESRERREAARIARGYAD